MSQPTKEKLGHTLQSESNEPNNLESTSLMEKQPIEDTPFEILREEDEYFLVWGEYKLTEAYNTWEEAANVLLKEKWLITARMVFAAIHSTKRKDTENSGQASPQL